MSRVLARPAQFYTNQIRGELEVVVVDTLLDLVDANGDGVIKYDEVCLRPRLSPLSARKPPLP